MDTDSLALALKLAYCYMLCWCEGVATEGLDGERVAEPEGNSSLVTLLKMAGASSSCSLEHFIVNSNKAQLLCFSR